MVATFRSGKLQREAAFERRRRAGCAAARWRTCRAPSRDGCRAADVGVEVLLRDACSTGSGPEARRQESRRSVRCGRWWRTRRAGGRTRARRNGSLKGLDAIAAATSKNGGFDEIGRCRDSMRRRRSRTSDGPSNSRASYGPIGFAMAQRKRDRSTWRRAARLPRRREARRAGRRRDLARRPRAARDRDRSPRGPRRA